MNSDQVVVTPGDATTTPDTEIDVDEEVAKAFIFDPGVELSEIVESINAVGASASDLVAILEALREAGSNKLGRSTLNESDLALVADWDLEAVKSSLNATVKISPI
ncbi:MAG: hypothetical protein CMD11_02900 [Flavobacteriales bacterium]|nr:hypothetical protein [Flavobacteriales bacterium]